MRWWTPLYIKVKLAKLKNKVPEKKKKKKKETRASWHSRSMYNHSCTNKRFQDCSRLMSLKKSVAFASTPIRPRSTS
jgi:hypothetical protein